ncbi:MAG: glycosyltransferase [Clostridia bacterium]|nr:glycosyltransferase [Clostridia bacterium]MDD3832116.1 glycosyltransferase [Clostridia bacterium]
MKITLVADIYGEQNNGTTITARRLVDNLRKRGHTVKVVSAHDCGTDCVVLPKRSFGIFNNYIEKKNGVGFARPDENKLREAIAGSDCVHFLLPFKVCQKGIKIARELGVPYTTAFHCQPENITSHMFMENFAPVNNYIYRMFYRDFYKYAHFIHCPSEFIASQLRKNGYIADIRVISNGVIPTYQPSPTPKPDNLVNKICILFIGRYSKEKRHDLLIDAVAKSSYSKDIQLIFAGCGPQQQHIEQLGKKLVNPPILRLFSKEELAETINYCDLYVHPSDVEIEAISCIEAFTCGLVPIISDSARSATKQFALCPESLFKQGDSQDLANRIDYWLTHPQEKAHKSAEYIEYGKNFAIEKCIDRMEQMMMDAVVYYKQYYTERSELYDTNKHYRYIYPDDPTQHMIHIKHVNNAPKKDSKYKFVNTGVLYSVYATALRILALVALPVYAKTTTKYKIVGKKNLRKVKGKGAVLVANHVHTMDTAIICACASPLRKINYVTLSDNVDIPIAGSIIKALGGIPLADCISGMKKFDITICRMLEDNKPILFFPEGSLWPEYKGIRPFHKGAFVYAIKSNVPIVPCIYTFRTDMTGKKLITLTICEPFYPQTSSPQGLADYTKAYFDEFTDKYYREHA